jgi:diketogulonate reductase-like aldo/keto reductase
MTDPFEADRRTLLIRMAATGALLASPRLLVAQATIPTRPIPVSGEALPVVGFGSSQAVVEIPTEGPEPVSRVLKVLFDLGGRVVDSSPRSEEIDRAFGEILKQPGRERMFLATKINTEGAANGIAQLRHMQRLFGRRTLDLVQVESLKDVAAHWPNLRAWKESGEARYIGVTVSNATAHERMEAFIQKEKPDFVQVNYSVVETAAEQRLLPLARDRGMAVLTNRPFMNGGYFPLVANRKLPEWAAEFDCQTWAQFSLKYILANSAVTCALTETSNPVHMNENVRTALGRLPDEATRQKMRDLVRQFS